MPSRISSPVLQLPSSSIYSTNLNRISFMKPYAREYIADYLNRQATKDLNEFNQLSVSPQNNVETKVPKKRVSFADSVGLELAEIRHITAGRDTPPIISPKAFASLNLPDEKPPMPTFTLDFQQPVSDYNHFRQSLDQNNVSLESVSINDNLLIGTVKVKNLSFQKSVVLRITYDGWTTTENVSAYYVNNGLVTAQGNEIKSSIDTFSFIHEIPIKRLKQNIQFAICFHCEGQEFWDNHGGSNYQIKVKSEHRLNQNTEMSGPRQSPSETNWTEFAIWRGLESDYTPYW